MKRAASLAASPTFLMCYCLPIPTVSSDSETPAHFAHVTWAVVAAALAVGAAVVVVVVAAVEAMEAVEARRRNGTEAHHRKPSRRHMLSASSP